VERALKQLRAAKVLSLDGIRKVPVSRLESLIHSSGYFRQKAHALKTFVASVDPRYGGCLTRMFFQLTEMLRQELLLLNGVGPETADSILFYAGQHPRPKREECPLRPFLPVSEGSLPRGLGPSDCLKVLSPATFLTYNLAVLRPGGVYEDPGPRREICV
jgi:hypothetical protein